MQVRFGWGTVTLPGFVACLSWRWLPVAQCSASTRSPDEPSVARTRARFATSGICVPRESGPGCRCAHPGYESAQDRRSRTCECIPIPTLKTSLILLASCPTRERFLEAIPKPDRARAGRPGAPRNGRRTGGQGGAPGGAAPYVTGRARLALSAARGEAILVSRVPAGALAPPAAPSPRVGSARDFANLGRRAPRERESVAI
jgi:hypothetical protein